MLYVIIHLPTFPVGFCFAMPCWKQHLESVTVQRWTLPIKTAIKKTILGDSTLISCPEPPVTASYYLSYTSCSISAVDTVVTIAEWQLFSGRYLSCTKYPACKNSPWLGFQFSISLTISQSTHLKRKVKIIVSGSFGFSIQASGASPGLLEQTVVLQDAALVVHPRCYLGKQGILQMLYYYCKMTW